MPVIPSQVDPVYLGVDLGTSGVKAVAASESGRVEASARADYPTLRPEPGAAEQDPADWTRAVAAVLSELAVAVPRDRWAGLGLSGMIPTLVVHVDGQAVGRAITWEDARAEDVGDMLRESLGPETLYARTGQWVDGRYLLPMATRLFQAGTLPAGAMLLGAKDHLMHLLTGQALTDPATATGAGVFDLSAGTWADDLVGRAITALGLPQLSLPEVVAATTTLPATADASALLGVPAGLPVTVGAADAICGVIGLGADIPGHAIYLAGTSNVILGVSASPVIDPDHRYLVTPLAGTSTGLEMDLLATGSAFAWLAEMTGAGGPAELVDEGYQVAVDDLDVPVFLPYVAPGEQGALWDPSVTGTLAGVTMRTTRGHLARALLTGIIAESMRCIDVLLDTPAAPTTVHLSGQTHGGRLAQELADATGVSVTEHRESVSHSALGAAILAGRAAGADIPAIADVRSFHPDPARRAVWANAFARHETLRHATAGH